MNKMKNREDLSAYIFIGTIFWKMILEECEIFLVSCCLQKNIIITFFERRTVLIYIYIFKRRRSLLQIGLKSIVWFDPLRRLICWFRCDICFKRSNICFFFPFFFIFSWKNKSDNIDNDCFFMECTIYYYFLNCKLLRISWENKNFVIRSNESLDQHTLF